MLARTQLRFKDMIFRRNWKLQADRYALYGSDAQDVSASRIADVDVGQARAQAAHALQRASNSLHPRNAAAIAKELQTASDNLMQAGQRVGAVAAQEQAKEIETLATLAGQAKKPLPLFVAPLRRALTLGSNAAMQYAGGIEKFLGLTR